MVRLVLRPGRGRPRAGAHPDRLPRRRRRLREGHRESSLEQTIQEERLKARLLESPHPPGCL